MNVLIVEDEDAAYKRMVKLLGELDPRIRIAGRTDTVTGTVDWLDANDPPDLAFFDVRLADGDSFGVFDRTEVPCPVIFTTAYDAHALQAFRVQALDYLLKPFGAERVHKALARARGVLEGGARRRLEAQYAGLLRTTAESGEHACILVKKRERTLVLRAAEIDYVEAYGDYVRLHVGAEIHTLRGTLGDMARRLAPAGFMRIHRSRLVNWQRVREFTTDRGHDAVVVLRNGTRLDASPACLRELQARLDAGS